MKDYIIESAQRAQNTQKTFGFYQARNALSD
jgi:hypothetical protein